MKKFNTADDKRIKTFIESDNKINLLKDFKMIKMKFIY